MSERHQRRDQTSELVRRDGALSVSFVNTTADRRCPLGDYAGLVGWCRQHGALSSAEADNLERRAAERPEDAAAAFRRAQDLRALLSLVFNSVADHEKPPTEAIESLNGYLSHTVPPQRLVPSDHGIELDWATNPETDLRRPLWRVLLSATAVLTSTDYGRLVRCAREGCGVLFVARNPGPPRKWCQKSCGQRSASLRHYHEKVRAYKAQVKKDVYDRLYGTARGQRG